MGWLSDVGDAFSDGWDAVSDGVSEFADDVEDTWEDFTDDVEDTWSDAWDSAEAAVDQGGLQGFIGIFGAIGAGIAGTVGNVMDLGANFSGNVFEFGSTLGGAVTGTLLRATIITVTGGAGSGTARDLGRFMIEGSRQIGEWGSAGLDLSGDLIERAFDIAATIILSTTEFARCLLGKAGSWIREGMDRLSGDSNQRAEEARFSAVNHIFVLMLENRSFDHLLGWATSPGVNGLGTGNYFNDTSALRRIPAGQQAQFSLEVDPPHEFPDVQRQLFGDPNTPNGGFVRVYQQELIDHLRFRDDPSPPMTAFTPVTLPVLHALASEFAVCDNWYSSLPGPTLPNRQFVHAATSGGMADSPSGASTAWAMTVGGFEYDNGTIFDRLDAKCIKWRVYAGDITPLVMTLKGMATDNTINAWTKIRGTNDLFNDLIEAEDDDFPNYVFIEPNYGFFWSDFTHGNSQHPLDSTVGGELLIKMIYESLRNSAIWETSALLIIYDEHGGFYDHVVPPATVPPGDRRQYESWAESDEAKSFQFDRLGIRVSAVIVSPMIERGTVDHTIYDHSSVVATVGKRFGFKYLTERDRAANTFDRVFTRRSPRTDTPMNLPDPVG
jgi:phospholipase C